MAPVTLLPDLTVTTCDKCDGYGFFEPYDPDDTPSGCLACSGTGEMEVCAGCGSVPEVVNGREACHCAVFVDWEWAA